MTREVNLLQVEVDKAKGMRGDLLRSGLVWLTMKLTEAQSSSGQFRVVMDHVRKWRERLVAWVDYEGLESKCRSTTAKARELEVRSSMDGLLNGV